MDEKTTLPQDADQPAAQLPSNPPDNLPQVEGLGHGAPYNYLKGGLGMTLFIVGISFLMAILVVFFAWLDNGTR